MPLMYTGIQENNCLLDSAVATDDFGVGLAKFVPYA